MPLSLHKLEKLLSSKGLIPKKFFTMHGSCVYIEVLNLSSADNFMLYIPSKYDIQIDPKDSSFNMKYIEISEDGTIPGDYAGEPDDVENHYDEIILTLSPSKQKGGMEQHLEENYKKDVSLQDIDRTDINQLREIFRQLRRLKFCVRNLKYKLCILYKNYLCCIRRDDSFEGFNINNFEGPKNYKLLVSLDLESFYGKMETINSDVKIVREGIYNILDKNCTKHVVKWQKISEKKNDITNFSEILEQKKKKYFNYLKHLELMLQKLEQVEARIIEKMTDIDGQYSSGDIKGLHMDISKTNQTSKYKDELHKITVIKQELIRNILAVKARYENLLLHIDKICFDNIIMMDAILKNFVTLSEL